MLSRFSQAELDMFRKDFMGVIHTCRKLNENVWRDDQGIRYNIDVMNKHVDNFSRKYRTLKIILEIGQYYEIKPIILLKDEQEFYNVFAVANSIAGNIESVTMFIEGTYKTATPSSFKRDFVKFKPCLKKGDVYFNFSSSKRLHLRCSEKYGMIELILDTLDFSVDDPEFKLCAYYGLSFGYGSEELEDIDNLFMGPVSSTEQQYRGSVSDGGAGL